VSLVTAAKFLHFLDKLIQSVFSTIWVHQTQDFLALINKKYIGVEDAGILRYNLSSIDTGPLTRALESQLVTTQLFSFSSIRHFLGSSSSLVYPIFNEPTIISKSSSHSCALSRASLI
ncbi:7160_t:CDS:2, partial [Funneliformis caledonium]